MLRERFSDYNIFNILVGVCFIGILIFLCSALTCKPSVPNVQTGAVQISMDRHEKDTRDILEKREKSMQNIAEKCVNVPLSEELQNFTRVEAERNGVPYPLVLAVIEQESRFDTEADSGDSFGLMQINECHGPREIVIQPHENIQIGCWLLGYLYREYGDWHKALIAYNCGEAGAEQMYFRHGYTSSPYSRQVMRRSEKWAMILGEEDK